MVHRCGSEAQTVSSPKLTLAGGEVFFEGTRLEMVSRGNQREFDTPT